MVVGFYNDVHGYANVLIIQCEHGESRSAAIAAAILKFQYKKGIRIFADERYCPNKSVFRKVFNVLQPMR